MQQLLRKEKLIKKKYSKPNYVIFLQSSKAIKTVFLGCSRSQQYSKQIFIFKMQTPGDFLMF